MQKKNLNWDPERAQVAELAEGVYARCEIDNMGWIDAGGFTVVVDTLEQPASFSEVRREIVRTAGEQPVRYVLNTHTHPDHVALNEDFRREGAEIINGRTAPPPAEGLNVEGDKRAVRLIPMGGCHTNYDCIVWLPGEKVMFVGDLFGWGLIPWMGNLTEDRRTLLLDTYSRLLEYAPETVVPGHGPLCSGDELRRWRDYFLWLIETVKRKLMEGYRPDQINSSVIPPPEDMRDWWRFVEWKHEDSIRKVAKATGRQWR